MTLKLITKHLGSSVAFAAVLSISTGAAHAAQSWNFKTKQSAWVGDTTLPKADSGKPQVFRVNFSNKAPLVTYTNAGATFRSQDVPNSPKGKTVSGSGVRNKTAFSSRDFTARCGVVGGAQALKNSQAAVWLKPSGNSTHEVDILEMKPAQGDVVNFINWTNNKPKRAGGGSWGGQPTMSNWRLTMTGAAPNRVITAYKGSAKKSYSKLKTRNIGGEIVLHNKAWRFTTNPAKPGAVASLVCQSASKK